jgi:hypothetical protein
MHIRIGNTVITKKTNAKTSENAYEIKNDMCPHLMKSVAVAIANKTSFEARDVMTLKEYLKRNEHVTELYVALCLLHDLGRQMQALLSGGHGIACFSVDDVIVIMHRESDTFTHKTPDSTLGRDPQFMFLNDRMIFEVDESDGALLIDRALNTKDAFVSPELAEQPNPLPIPTRVNFKTAYHSAAQLIIYFLLAETSDPSDPSDSSDSSNLNPIKGTKLYWFLQRCLNRVPSERNYVYV